MIEAFLISDIIAKGGQEYLAKLKSVAKRLNDRVLFIESDDEAFRAIWSEYNPGRDIEERKRRKLGEFPIDVFRGAARNPLYVPPAPILNGKRLEVGPVGEFVPRPKGQKANAPMLFKAPCNSCRRGGTTQQKRSS